MRIAVFYNIPFGGAGRAVYEMAHRLSQRHHVSTYTLGAQGLGLELLESLEPRRPVVYRGFRPIRRPFGRLHSITSLVELARLNRAYEQLGRVVSDACDIAIVHQCPYTSAPLLLRHVSVPTLLWIGEPLRHLHEPAVERAPTNRLLGKHSDTLDALDPFIALQRRVITSVERSCARRASAVMTYSYYAREVLYRIYGVDASVNYLGIDPEVFRPLPIPKEHMVLSLGHTTPLKGHDFVIESIARISEPIRPQLVIAGDVSDPNEWRYLRDLAASRNVRLTQERASDDETIVARYNRAKAMAFAPIMEPLGLAPLEAMACQVPVVGVKEAGVRETVREGGYLVDRNIDAFAEKIALLLSSDELRMELGRRGREYVKREWTWGCFMERLEAALTNIASPSQFYAVNHKSASS